MEKAGWWNEENATRFLDAFYNVSLWIFLTAVTQIPRHHFVWTWMCGCGCGRNKVVQCIKVLLTNNASMHEFCQSNCTYKFNSHIIKLYAVDWFLFGKFKKALKISVWKNRMVISIIFIQLYHIKHAYLWNDGLKQWEEMWVTSNATIWFFVRLGNGMNKIWGLFQS